MTERNELLAILDALDFAAAKHRDQRRKGAEASPYVNHLIEVARTLAECGVADAATLQAGILHDTLEDTETVPAELEARFGADVLSLVREVTDDKGLRKEVRKQLQIEHAPTLTDRAKRIKIADKISNVRAVADHPPRKWTLKRRLEYLDWGEKVVAGCRGVSPALERLYDDEAARAREKLARAREKLAKEESPAEPGD